ncbi:hypothetical protein KOR42_32960 [Thalassoglobus neptunius]|uniref:Uncharacterized protein n=1 Tax=Thalassoglobus neptunius TaxID=1938619 RepID=A0A5C5WP59_9PLAN|nr:hypothetical protein KOR42_32960 [Thalassoglobus neptunius]
MEFKAGDIIAFWGGDLPGRAISLMTSSILPPWSLSWAPSHVGLAMTAGQNSSSARMLIESTNFSKHPCRLTNRLTKGLQAQGLSERVRDYETSGGSWRAFRLTWGNELDEVEVDYLRGICRAAIYRGVGYDWTGAGLSGTRLLQLTRLFPTPSAQTLFCSEFIAYALQSLCRMNRANPTRYNPGRLLRELVSTGVYEEISTEEKTFE